ncbi:hypothetical protein [Shimia sp.]|uniref:hypothetical protein n=1 Tax=Shimia sp. TaxID=1954381 RepID=UPI003BACBF71
MKSAAGILAVIGILQLPHAALAKGGLQRLTADQASQTFLQTQPVLAKSKAGHCPPGLAKKAVPCVPPGQVKRYRVGDHINGGFIRIGSPERYGLRRTGHYVKAGDYVYEIDEDTHEVLNLIGAIADVLD